MDVNDEDAMRLIRERDQRRHFKRLARFTLLSIAIMIPLNALCVAATFSLFLLSLDYTEALIELTPLWLLGHVGLFGVSVMWGEQYFDARFPTRRISELVDGTPEDGDVPSRGIWTRLSDFIHVVMSSRRSG